MQWMLRHHPFLAHENEESPVKIAVVPDATTRQRVLTDAHLAELAAIGEVSVNDAAEVTADRVAELASDAEVIVTSWGCPPFDAALLARLPSLRLVVHAAGSVKELVSPEFFDRGLRVSSGNGPLGVGVAETALGMTIASLKNLWRMVRDTDNGGWWDERPRVRELYDVTIGVIGAGKAGSHYIRLLQGFEVDVLLYDPMVSTEAAIGMGATKVELDQLLSDSDVISIHAPSIPETDGLINAAALARMKDDAILINTARGTIVDEQALIEELKRGRIFACLDVTEPEPPAADHPLRGLPNCVLTGHVAGAVTNGAKRLGRHAVAEVRRFAAGETLLGEVRAEQLAVLA
jgi:phosphoglycerate dehydrogenase-like enzyme